MTGESNIQHKPQRSAPGAWGFDDSKCKIAVTDFSFDEVDAHLAGGGQDGSDGPDLVKIIRDAEARGALRLLEFLCAGDPSAKEIGCLAIIKLHKIKRRKTQAMLARQLGVSQQWVSHLLVAEDSKNTNVYAGN